MIKKLFLAFCFIFLTSFSAIKYEPVQDLEFVEYHGSGIINGHQLNYVIYNNIGKEKSLDQNMRVASNIISTSEKLVNYISDHDFSTQDCRIVNKLEVFIIDTEVLNDKTRFSNYKKPEQIWGLFDPRAEDLGIASIVLTDHGDFNQILIAHELSHYWYYRFCLDFYTRMDTEIFALKLENINSETK